jgi:hypothetical protein
VLVVLWIGEQEVGMCWVVRGMSWFGIASGRGLGEALRG